MYFFEMNFPFGELKVWGSFLGIGPKLHNRAMTRGLGLEAVQSVSSRESEECRFPQDSNKPGSLPKRSERLFWIPLKQQPQRGMGAKSRVEGQDQSLCRLCTKKWLYVSD